MDKRITDQAEGLRRLLAGRATRIVAVTGGPAGVGRTSAVVNLAAALAALGKDVLVVDERNGAASAAATLGGAWPRNGGTVRHAAGFSLRVAAADRLAADLEGAADIVLVDAQRDAHGALSALARAAHDVLIVTRVAGAAITEAYACMKRLHYAHALAQFRVLVNHVRSESDARAAYENLAGVAGRYLTVALAEGGYVSADPLVPRARDLGHTVVDAFPSSAAARDYRQIAADLLYWPMRPTRLAGRACAARSAVERGTAHAV